jgi:murein DD-endopeptidase MepM/ murein hydrolase activator NlpD
VGWLRPGMEVKRGQHIAYVGKLRLKNKKTDKIEIFPKTMLHFELYKGNATGDLTDKMNSDYKNVPKLNYMRRWDLLNPTTIIDKMVLK